MPTRSDKHTIVTFKADSSLMEALRSIPNRSAFIRSAILAAMDNVCPLCRGTGILTPAQKTHWESFAQNHRLTECEECNEWHLVCGSQRGGSPHGRRKSRRGAAGPAARGDAR